MDNSDLTPEEQFELYLNQRDQKRLILHNDDVNTFKHVIVTLMHICEHDAIQAEQCATLIHHKGSCHIKTGSPSEIAIMKMRLIENNLNVSVE